MSIPFSGDTYAFLRIIIRDGCGDYHYEVDETGEMVRLHYVEEGAPEQSRELLIPDDPGILRVIGGALIQVADQIEARKTAGGSE